MLSLLCLTFLLKLVSSTDLAAVFEDLEELEPGQPYRLENGLEITSVKKPKKCVKKASHGDIVVLHYVGRTQGPEGKIFDDTKSKGFPFKFELGGGRSIKGLDHGMRGVCKGEQREIFVPSDLASGGRGVPAGTDLHYRVSVLSIEDRKKGNVKHDL